jgi:hypothetical protein
MNIPKKRNTGPSLDRALVELGKGFDLSDACKELEQANLDIGILLSELDSALDMHGDWLTGEYAEVVRKIRKRWAGASMEIPTPQPLSKAASAKRMKRNA